MVVCGEDTREAMVRISQIDSEKNEENGEIWLTEKKGRRISEERWRVKGSKSRGGRREIKGRRERERERGRKREGFKRSKARPAGLMRSDFLCFRTAC